MFIAFDTEDNSRELLLSGRSGFDKKVTQVAAMDSTGTTFHDESGRPDRFLEWIMGFPQGTKIYAHNLQYDLGNLFGDRLDALDVTLIGNRLIRARFHHLVFLDSFNIWPMSLAKLGDAFGLKKGELDVYSKEYVFRDVEIVLRAMSFVHGMAVDFKVENIPSTLGSLCVKVWQAMGGINWHDGFSVSREALYGGRVELFSTGGEGRILYCDVNSLYPYAMTLPFPRGLELAHDIDGFGIARVQLYVPRCDIAPLPVRRDDGAILYPTGYVEGVYTFHEIRNAMQHGAKVLKVLEAYGTHESEPYYQGFVNQFYKLRKGETNEAKKLFYKLLMNNLYGQLGMTGAMTRSLKTERAEDRVGTPYGGKKLCDVEIPLREHVNYIHAAYVTSYGRIILQDFLRMIPIKDLIYCDTDSVIFFCKGKPPFPISDSLGEMKLEGEATRAYTYAPKTYRFGEYSKAKGIKRQLAAQFIKDGFVDFDQPFKFREAVSFFDRGNQKKLSVWRNVRKELRTVYDKKVLTNGYYSPIHLRRSDGRLNV